MCDAQVGCALEAAAGTSHHGRVLRERGLSPVQCFCIGYGSITTSAALRARAASPRAAPTPERHAAQRCSRVCHAKVGYALEVPAGTSHHGRAPKERGLSPGQCSCIWHRPTTASVARRACAASSRAAQPPERHPPQRHVRTCDAKVGCTLEAAAGTSHHGRVLRERGLSPVQCFCTRYGPITTSAARRASKPACCAYSRETCSEVARACVPRKSRLCVGGPS